MKEKVAEEKGSILVFWVMGLRPIRPFKNSVFHECPASSCDPDSEEVV